MMRGIVVVGAGPAGLRCAERLAEAGRDVTLVGAESCLPYNRVALSQYLAADIDAAALVTADSLRLAALRIRHLPGVRATAIDRDAHALRTDAGIVPYDSLVLATGADPVRLPLPGGQLPGVRAYRTLEDVDAMIAAARAGGEAVVIGGGLLGLEAAAGLAKRGMRVTVLHAVDRLMERQLDHHAAGRLTRHLVSQGVNVELDARSEAIEGDRHVEAIRLRDGRRIAADLVIMAVGIRPNAALAREAGLAVARGIVVDDAMRTSDENVFAIGECAEHRGQCCGLVAPALAQAQVAARVLCGEIATYAPDADAAALKVAGAPVWSAGEIDAGTSDIVTLDDPHGAYRRLLLRDDRLVGAMLYGATEDAPWYMRLIRERTPIGPMRGALPFGPAFVEAPSFAEAST
jgi:nitrite reductase (NADH) large subunit